MKSIGDPEFVYRPWSIERVLEAKRRGRGPALKSLVERAITNSTAAEVVEECDKIIRDLQQQTLEIECIRDMAASRIIIAYITTTETK